MPWWNNLSIPSPPSKSDKEIFLWCSTVSGSMTTSSTSPMEYSESCKRSLQQHFLHWMVQCADCDKLSTPVLTLTPTWRELCPRMLPSCLSKDNGGALKQEQRWWFSTAFLLPMISNRSFTKLCFQFLKSSHPYICYWTMEDIARHLYLIII